MLVKIRFSVAVVRNEYRDTYNFPSNRIFQLCSMSTVINCRLLTSSVPARTLLMEFAGIAALLLYALLC